MEEKGRVRQALQFSIVIHIVAFILWGYLDAELPEFVDLRVVQVEWVGAPSPAVASEPQQADIPPQEAVRTAPQSAVVAARRSSVLQNEDGGALSSAALGISSSASDDGHGGLGSGGTGEAGFGGDRNGVVSQETSAASGAPSPGSMGYSSASLLHSADPVYPSREERSGVGGTVEVRISIAPDGAPTNCVIAQTSGNAALDRAAIDAAWRCRFAPAQDLATGEAVAATVVLPFHFVPTENNGEDALW